MDFDDVVFASCPVGVVTCGNDFDLDFDVSFMGELRMLGRRTDCGVCTTQSPAA